MNAEELKKMQCDQVETAKAILKKENRLDGVVFLVSTKQKIERLLDIGMSITGSNKNMAQASSLAEDDEMTIGVPFPLPPKNVCKLLSCLARNEDTWRFELLENGAKLLYNAGYRDIWDVTCNAMIESLRLTQKDVIANCVLALARITDASAVIKIDEAWMAEEAAGPIGASLENDKRAGECIISLLETREFTRLVMVPFTRTERNTGQVVGFGDAREHLYTADDPNATLVGRFTHFLNR